MIYANFLHVFWIYQKKVVPLQSIYSNTTKTNLINYVKRKQSNFDW